jgi:histidinol-phosphate phosphatase family protein
MEISSWGVDESWTLFLDRDGVINERIFGGYVLDWNDFHFLPGVLEGLARVRGKFARIVVVTNQQCVALELISQSGLMLIHERMCQQVAESGGNIDAVFAAIELKNDPASRRKPKTNMALEAQELFAEIDFSKCIMVGDTGTDLQFGQALGMKTVLIESLELVTNPSDFRCGALSTFLEKI